jgi:hypothetical protein
MVLNQKSETDFRGQAAWNFADPSRQSNSQLSSEGDKPSMFRLQVRCSLLSISSQRTYWIGGTSRYILRDFKLSSSAKAQL